MQEHKEPTMGEENNKGPHQKHEPRLAQTCRTETQIKQTIAKKPQGAVESGTTQQQEIQ